MPLFAIVLLAFFALPFSAVYSNGTHLSSCFQGVGFGLAESNASSSYTPSLTTLCLRDLRIPFPEVSRGTYPPHQFEAPSFRDRICPITTATFEDACYPPYPRIGEPRPIRRFPSIQNNTMFYKVNTTAHTAPGRRTRHLKLTATVLLRSGQACFKSESDRRMWDRVRTINIGTMR